MTEAFEVRLAGTARRDLRRVPPRIAPAIVEFIFGDLAHYPRRAGKPLERQLEGTWSARRGPYRILYQIHEDQLVVIVVHVATRADAYHHR